MRITPRVPMPCQLHPQAVAPIWPIAPLLHLPLSPPRSNSQAPQRSRQSRQSRRSPVPLLHPDPSCAIGHGSSTVHLAPRPQEHLPWRLRCRVPAPQRRHRGCCAPERRRARLHGRGERDGEPSHGARFGDWCCCRRCQDRACQCRLWRERQCVRYSEGAVRVHHLRRHRLLGGNSLQVEPEQGGGVPRHGGEIRGQLRFQHQHVRVHHQSSQGFHHRVRTTGEILKRGLVPSRKAELRGKDPIGGRIRDRRRGHRRSAGRGLRDSERQAVLQAQRADPHR